MAVTDGVQPGIQAYWDEFYRHQPRTAPMDASTFAQFVIGTCPEIRSLVELGCGNGRDSRFFASQGLEVLAIDASAAAIKVCRDNLPPSGTLQFNEARIEDVGDQLGGFVARSQAPVCLYARFVLHAITAEQEQSLFDIIDRDMPPGSLVAFEYRTEADADAEKVYGSTHYRRFIKHEAVCERLTALGFTTLHQENRTGLAPHRGEDPVIGRFVGRR